MRNSRMLLALLAGLLIWHNVSSRPEANTYPSCQQVINNHFYHGTLPANSMTPGYYCHAGAGISHVIWLHFSPAGGTPFPGDINNLINLKLYRQVGSNLQHLEDSQQQTVGERITRSGSGEIWYIQIENRSGINGIPAVNAVIDAWIPGGCAGCATAAPALPTGIEPPATPTASPAQASMGTPTGESSVPSSIGPTISGSITACRALQDIHLLNPPPQSLPAGGIPYELTCSVVAGKTYRILLDYDQVSPTPGDAGSYLGIKLFDAQSSTWLADSSVDGYKRESITRTASSDGAWLIKIENLAVDPAYDTQVDAWIPGGCAGCHPTPPPPTPF